MVRQARFKIQNKWQKKKIKHLTQTQDNKLTLKQRSSETKFINKTQIARQNKVKANQDQEQIIKTGGKQQQQDVKTFRDMRRVETLQKGTQNHDNQDKS